MNDTTSRSAYRAAKLCCIIAITLAPATAIGITSATSAGADVRLMKSDEISAARRTTPAPTQRPYRGFADPSLGPDGRPYRVPDYL